MDRWGENKHIWIKYCRTSDGCEWKQEEHEKPSFKLKLWPRWQCARKLDYLFQAICNHERPGATSECMLITTWMFSEEADEWVLSDPILSFRERSYTKAHKILEYILPNPFRTEVSKQAGNYVKQNLEVNNLTVFNQKLLPWVLLLWVHKHFTKSKRTKAIFLHGLDPNLCNTRDSDLFHSENSFWWLKNPSTASKDWSRNYSIFKPDFKAKK